MHDAQDAPATQAGPSAIVRRANGAATRRTVLCSGGREQFMAASAPPSFVHLHAHSSYSLSEGAIKADKLAALARDAGMPAVDRKSTRLNSSHANISYAVFCLKRKRKSTRLKSSHANSTYAVLCF